MTPTLVHRYSWPIREAIEALLGDAVGDCDAWRIRVEVDELVIDVVASVLAPTLEPADETLGVTPQVSPVDKALAEPERKGGPLARKAAMLCQDKGFRTFVSLEYETVIRDADQAATWLRATCGVDSRADLDHEPAAAEAFQAIDRAYGVWVQGY